MPDQTAPPHGVMEGKGAYNRYAKLPAGGAVLALPLLEGAVRRLELDTNDQTVVIADYGSSQGKNSMVPMDIAIRGLRLRIGTNRPISVFHIDQPSNDFNGRCSRFWMPTRTGMFWTTRTSFPPQSENHSTKMCCRPAPCISDGRPTPLCGSAESRH